MNKNIKTNIAFNVIRRITSIIFPLITYPYALRVLHSDGIGKVEYGHSIVHYFSLIAMLGVSTYAVREGAKLKHDKEKFSSFVNEVYTINLATTLVAYIFLVAMILVVDRMRDYSLLILLQSVSILLVTLSVEWINVIYEDFVIMTIRTVFIHIISMIALFVFVRTPADYYLYAFLTVLSDGIICCVNWYYCSRYVKVRPVWHFDAIKHLKPMLIMFANTIAVSIYVSIDITMLGWFRGDYDVGIYSISVKVYHIVKNIMVAIYAVSIPRLAVYIGENNLKAYKDLYSKLWMWMSLLLLPTCVGIISEADDILYILGGEEYLKSVWSLRILSIALIFAIFGGLLTACLNVTISKEKNTLYATIGAAFINVFLNIWLIPKYSYIAAASTTLLSELFVFVFCFIMVRNKKDYLDLEKIRVELLHTLYCILAIAGSIFIIRKIYTDHSIYRLIISVIVSIIIYSMGLYLLEDSVFIDFIRRGFKREKSD